MYRDLVCHEIPAESDDVRHIGVLKGEGVGPEVVDAALECLEAVAERFGLSYSLSYGGEIGKASERKCGAALSSDVKEFCSAVLSRGGAILTGAGGGRFVYDMRREFDLYCKLSPLRPFRVLGNAGCLKASCSSGVDIMIVRENISGIYQGEWTLYEENGSPCAGHSFRYREGEVMDILRAAARVSSVRSGRLCVVYKESGVPSISHLWRSCATRVESEFGVQCEMIDVDYAAYRLIREATELDVVVAPNLFGDVLSDLGALLLGSRGMSYSANFSKTGAAVYQTNHGAAHDLAGTDRANPIGQVLSLGMLIRETMGSAPAANAIERAVQDVLQQGYRTFDISEEGCHIVGTRELGERIADQIRMMKSPVDDEIAGAVAN